MCPFSVTLQQNVPDRELGPLLIKLPQVGFHNPTIRPIDAGAHPRRGRPCARAEHGSPGGLAARAGAGGRVLSVAGGA